MPVAKKSTPKAGKFLVGYYYSSRGKKDVSLIENVTFTTKEAAIKAAERLLNGRNGYYTEILILEITSKVALERVPVTVVEVE